MKVAIVFLAVVACALAGTYTTKFDNVNLDEILENERLLQNYVKCLLGEGNCTPDGKELKTSLPDALRTDCKKCSEKQKVGSDKVIRHLVNKRPEIWKKLAVKYDPTGEYQIKFRSEADKKGIKI